MGEDSVQTSHLDLHLVEDSVRRRVDRADLLDQADLVDQADRADQGGREDSEDSCRHHLLLRRLRHKARAYMRLIQGLFMDVYIVTHGFV